LIHFFSQLKITYYSSFFRFVCAIKLGQNRQNRLNMAISLKIATGKTGLKPEKTGFCQIKNG